MNTQTMNSYRRAQVAGAVLGSYALIGGVVSFTGWVFDLQRLTDWDNKGISIQPNTCIAVVAAGTALIALTFQTEIGLFLMLLGWTGNAISRQTKRREEADQALHAIQERINEQREALLRSEHESRKHAEDANKLKDEFLATLSHELRNPLNVILGYSELLLRTPEIAGHSHLLQMSQALKRNAQSQSQLINDLLDLSRLQTGKVSLNCETVSLSTIVDNAVETVRAEAAAKQISVSVTTPDELLIVEADPLRMQQVVWNLLNNAVKFAPTGGRIDIFF